MRTYRSSGRLLHANWRPAREPKPHTGFFCGILRHASRVPDHADEAAAPYELLLQTLAEGIVLTDTDGKTVAEVADDVEKALA